MKLKWFAIFIMIVLCLALPLKAEVSLEEVVQAGSRSFYRDHADPHKYYYIPGEPRLATKSDGTPEFTFIKYSKTGGDIKGGIVHFLVSWGMSGSEVMSAESALQMIDAQAKVAGPVPFREGTFKIVSATAGQGGLFNVKICGEGKAPIMPNQKAAVSIALTQEGATLLWESFKNPTSDISVMFMMKYTGITPAYQAKIKVDWDKVYTHEEIGVQAKAQVKVFQAEADVKAILDDLKQKGAIQVDVVGENQNMQKLLDVAYNHLIKLMCDTEMKMPGEIKSTKSADNRRTETDGFASIIKNGILTLFGRKPVFAFEQPGLASMLPYSDAIVAGMEFAREEAQSQQEQVAQTGGCSQEQWDRAHLSSTRAINLLHRGQTVEGIAELENAYQACPEPGYLNSIASAYWEQLFKYQKAVSYYEQFIEKAGSVSQYQSMVQTSRQRIATFQEADTHLQAGTQYFAQNKFREALQEFEKANALAPHIMFLKNFGACYFNLGWDSRNVEDFKTSLNHYKKFLSEAQKSPDYQGKQEDIAEAQGHVSQIETVISTGRHPDGGQLSNGQQGTSAQTSTARPPQTSGSQGQQTSGQAGQTSPSRPSVATGEGKPPAGTPARPGTSSKKPSESGKAPAGKPTGTPKVEAPFQLKISYTFRRIKMTGHYEVDLRQRLREEREMVMSGNISGIYAKYGEDKRFFDAISLDDPVFQERTINVILDGQDFSDFKNYINAISVVFKKQRWGKDPTTGEVKFFDEQFAQKGNILKFIYSREGEASTEWLNYEYKPKWSFYGGIEWEGPWIKASDPVITLAPTAKYRTIQISLDQDNLLKSKIRAVAFQIKHQIFGKEVLKEVVIDYAKGDPLEAQHRYLHEEGKLAYSYKTIWLFMDGREIHSQWMNKESPFIYGYYSQ